MMMSASSVDDAFNKFFLDCLPDAERLPARALASRLTADIDGIAARLQGAVADRQGRTRLAQAVKERLRDG